MAVIQDKASPRVVLQLKICCWGGGGGTMNMPISTEGSGISTSLGCRGRTGSTGVGRGELLSCLYPLRVQACLP